MKLEYRLLTACTIFVVISSCSKSSHSLTNTQLLTQHTWEMESLIFQKGNVQSIYTRGSANTTGYNYDNDRFTFKSDGTGTLIDDTNANWTFTWSFAPGDETKMTVIVNYTAPLTLNWSFVEYGQKTFFYTQSYEEGGTEVLATTELIPAS